MEESPTALSVGAFGTVTAIFLLFADSAAISDCCLRTLWRTEPGLEAVVLDEFFEADPLQDRLVS